ncbi:YbaB/EbfC family nucleoid-associated protein [Amycolatopsis lurida]
MTHSGARPAAELDAELAQARYPAKSADGAVTATVTGHGRLADLRIADSALYGPHADRLGIAVVQAISAARRAASEAAFPKIQVLLGRRTATPQAVPEPERAPAPRRARPDEVEESYDQIDFIDGDPTDNDLGGGRW